MMRLATDILLLLLVLYLPWWAALLAAAFFFFVFPDFYELLAVGLLLDLLYGAPQERLGGFQFVFSLGTVAIFLLLSFGKKRVRM